MTRGGGRGSRAVKRIKLSGCEVEREDQSVMAQDNLIISAGAAGGGAEELLIDTSEENDLFLSVFSNDLLWEKIASYLNHSDLKASCLVNHLFLDKIRGHKAFIDNLKLVICKESYKTKVLTRTKLRWKKGDVELSTLPSKALPSIKRILHSIESLELYENYGVSEKDRTHFLKEILSNAVNLRSLSLDCSIVERLPSSFFAERTIQNRLNDLTELKIVTGRKEETKMVSCQNGSSPFPQNLLKLSQAQCKLSSFVFQKVDTYYGHNQKEHVTFVPQLVKHSENYLTELTLQLHVWSLDSMKNILCPNLKKLFITAYRRNENIVKTFLDKQPFLESLTVQFKNGFPLSIINVISRRGIKLQKLHLKAASFTDSPDLIDWSFLLHFKLLEDFEIFQPRAFIGAAESQGTCSQYLNSLPDGVKAICLRGLEHGWAGNIVTNTTSCLQRFTNLTKLSLTRCEETINDEILQFICLNLTKLRILEFSHCQNLTDFGLTGVNNDGTSSCVGLKSLKGLKKIKLRECRQVSEEGLLASIEFLELVQLDVTIRNAPLGKATLIQLARQNPSLQSMIINSPSPLEPNFEQEIKQGNPRLKSISYIHEDWGVEDSDSDAEEFDEEFESSDDGSFDSWDWDSDFDDEDDVISFDGGNIYSDFSDPDED